MELDRLMISESVATHVFINDFGINSMMGPLMNSASTIVLDRVDDFWVSSDTILSMNSKLVVD